MNSWLQNLDQMLLLKWALIYKQFHHDQDSYKAAQHYAPIYSGYFWQWRKMKHLVQDDYETDKSHHLITAEHNISVTQANV